MGLLSIEGEFATRPGRGLLPQRPSVNGNREA